MPQGLAAGLLQGAAIGKQQKRERSMEDVRAEREKQKFELDKLKAQMQMKALEQRTKLQEHIATFFTQKDSQAWQTNERNRDDRREIGHLMIEARSQQQGQGQPPIQSQQEIPQQGTPMGESMQQGQQEEIPRSLLEMMAVGGMEGPARALQQIKSGERLERQGNRRADISEDMLGQRVRANDLTEQKMKQGWKPVTVTNPDGSTSTIMMPQFPGVGGVGSAIQTKPGAKSLPIMEQNLPLWRHKDTLDSPPPGMSPNKATAQGYKRLNTGQVEAIQNFAQVENILNTIDDLMEKVFPEDESALGRLVGGPKRTLSALAQTNTDAAMLMRLINGTLAPIVRSMGEKGNLSDTDIKRAAKLFPNLMDRGDVAWGMLEELRGIISKNKKVKFGGMGLKVSKKIVRTGKDKQGRKVVQYNDGTIEYAK